MHSIMYFLHLKLTLFIFFLQIYNFFYTSNKYTPWVEIYNKDCIKILAYFYASNDPKAQKIRSIFFQEAPFLTS